MAKTDEKVMKMVEAELEKNPAASVEELFEKAKALGSMGRINRRQFHARYPLQVKRRLGGAGSRPRKAGTGRRRGRPRQQAVAAASAGSNRMRDVLLRLAQDVAAAESPAALVKLIANVDRYVEEALKAAAK